LRKRPRERVVELRLMKIKKKAALTIGIDLFVELPAGRAPVRLTLRTAHD